MDFYAYDHLPATFPTPSELAATSTKHYPQSLPVPPSDGISSHEKKRHYLECLEQYVIFLHHQLLLVGLQPIPLERSTSNSRGMTSKSIRVRPPLFPLLFIHPSHRLFSST